MTAIKEKAASNHTEQSHLIDRAGLRSRPDPVMVTKICLGDAKRLQKLLQDLCSGVRCSRNMDAKAKKDTLRLLTNGVYVLTSRNGDDYGVATVTWVSQVSFQPPLVMAALRKDGNVFRCLRASGVAVLHIVGAGQQDLAQKFFSTTKESDGLLNGEPFTEGKTSAPVLKNLSPYLECKLVDVCEDYGDHAIVILEVVEAANRATVVPLVVNDSPWKYGG